MRAELIENMIEKLSEAAHDAWMEAKVEQGVCTRRSEWGEELMVPYRDLSEQAKDLDRSTVRGVLAAIDRAGYAISMAEMPPTRANVVMISFDVDAFYVALDRKRRQAKKRWRDIARETGVSSSTFTRISYGYRPDVDNLVRLLLWLGTTDISPFVVNTRDN